MDMAQVKDANSSLVVRWKYFAEINVQSKTPAWLLLSLSLIDFDSDWKAGKHEPQAKTYINAP